DRAGGRVGARLEPARRPVPGSGSARYKLAATLLSLCLLAEEELAQQDPDVVERLLLPARERWFLSVGAVLLGLFEDPSLMGVQPPQDLLELGRQDLDFRRP